MSGAGGLISGAGASGTPGCGGGGASGGGVVGWIGGSTGKVALLRLSNAGRRVPFSGVPDGAVSAPLPPHPRLL